MQSSFSLLFLLKFFSYTKGNKYELTIILVDETLSLSIHAKQFLLLLWFLFTLSLFPFIFSPIFSILYLIGTHSSVFSISLCCVSSVQSLSRVRLFATPWIIARQASLSITNSRSSLRLTCIESVMPSSHLIFCHPIFLLPPIPPSIRVFPMSQLFAWGG